MTNFVSTDIEQVLKQAIALAKAGYWDAAIDLLEAVIASLKTK